MIKIKSISASKVKRSKMKKLLLVIGILSSVLIVLFVWLSYKRLQATNMQRNKDILYIGKLLEKYHDRYGTYPCPPHATACRWDEELQKVNNGNPIPKDPKTQKEYTYVTDGQHSLVGAEKDFGEPVCFGGGRYFWVIYKTIYKRITSDCTANEKFYNLDLTWPPYAKPNDPFLNWPSSEG